MKTKNEIYGLYYPREVYQEKMLDELKLISDKFTSKIAAVYSFSSIIQCKGGGYIPTTLVTKLSGTKYTFSYR